MNIVTRYQCQYCKKELKTAIGMAKHEAKCLRNEEKLACVTCNNFVCGINGQKWMCLINSENFFKDLPDHDGEPCSIPYPTYQCSQWEKRLPTWDWYSEVSKDLMKQYPESNSLETVADLPF